MEDSSLQHISTYRPPERLHGVNLAGVKLAVGSGASEPKHEANGLQFRRLRPPSTEIRSWKQAPNPAFDLR